MTKRKSLEGLVSSAAHVFGREVGKDCKPNSGVWRPIRIVNEQECHHNDIGYIYVGDKLTDAKFGASDPDIYTIIIPSSLQARREVNEFRHENPQYQNRIQVIKRDDLRRTLEKLLSSRTKNWPKRKAYRIYFDIDGTVGDKLDIAQSIAARRLGEHFQHIMPEIFNGSAIEYMSTYDQNFSYWNPNSKKHQEKISGSDLRLALSIATVLDHYKKHNSAATTSEEFVLHNKEMLDKYDGDIKVLVSDLQRTSIIRTLARSLPEFPESNRGRTKQLILYDNHIDVYMPYFRHLEAQASKDCIQRGEVKMYSEVVDTIEYFRRRSNIKIGFVTNKPWEVYILIKKLLWLKD